MEYINSIIEWFNDHSDYFASTPLDKFLRETHEKLQSISRVDTFNEDVKELITAYDQEKRLVDDYYDKVKAFDLKSLRELGMKYHYFNMVNLMLDCYSLVLRVEKENGSTKS